MPLGRWFDDRSIEHKLRLLLVATSSLAVLGACAFFLAHQWWSSRAVNHKYVSLLAAVIGDQAVAAIEFSQPRQAADILRSMRAEEQVVGAAIYTRDGRRFAHFVRGDADPQGLPPRPGRDGASFEDGELRLFAPILSGGERLGTFYVHSDLSRARHRLWLNTGFAALVLIGMIVVIHYASRRIGGHIAEPIQHLAQVVQAVSASRDYSLRSRGGGSDEVGRLSEGFDHMLQQIQTRDRALAQAHDELERRVEERTALLAAANRELESFSYSVSHDLRAPLRAVGGFARMLQEDCAASLDAQGREYVQVIVDSSRRMGQLIDDLLAFSQMGRRALEKRSIDMVALVEEVVRDLRAAHPERERDFTITSLPPVRGDLSMLRQALVNLLSNAVKYSRGRPDPRIEIGADERDGETIYFVADHGVGFDMRYAHKLFGVFQRLHSAREFEGTGVGLALAARIIERHRGRIWAEGEVGVGATFYFTLPR